MSAVTVETVVANIVVKMIIEGTCELWAALRLIIVAGIRVRLEVFKASKVHIAGDAEILLLFRSCRSFIAIIPRGVAELPSPSILALKFNKIDPDAGWLSGISGNNLEKIGFITLLKSSVNFASRAIFIIPDHNASGPINLIEILTVSSIPLKIASDTLSILPVNIAVKIPITIKTNQIILII